MHPFCGFRLSNLFNSLKNDNKIGYFDVGEEVLKPLLLRYEYKLYLLS